LTLLSEVLNWDVSFWSILWPTALLVFGLQGLTSKFSFFSMGSVLFGGYFLLDNLNVIHLDLGGMIWPVIVVLWGLSLLVDALRKKTGSHFYINRKGSDQHRSTCTMGNESFQCSTSFGESHRTITLPRLSSGEASVSFGNLTVDLSECEEISGNCRIEAHCSFGEMEILVPRRWRVEHNASSAFANVDISGHPAANAEGTIFLDCHVSFGEIDIKYI
jgi:predicted membrane protein